MYEPLDWVRIRGRNIAVLNSVVYEAARCSFELCASHNCWAAYRVDAATGNRAELLFHGAISRAEVGRSIRRDAAMAAK
jgi:hypothetical protein